MWRVVRVWEAGGEGSAPRVARSRLFSSRAFKKELKELTHLTKYGEGWGSAEDGDKCAFRWRGPLAELKTGEGAKPAFQRHRISRLILNIR